MHKPKKLIECSVLRVSETRKVGEKRKMRNLFLGSMEDSTNSRIANDANLVGERSINARDDLLDPPAHGCSRW